MVSSSGVDHLSRLSVYGRKSCFMKWLSKIFKGGSKQRLTGRDHQQLLEDEDVVLRTPSRSMGDRSRTEKDREDLDRKSAESLSEDLKRPDGFRWRMDDADYLDRGLRDRPNSPDYLDRGLRDRQNRPSYPPSKPSYPPSGPDPYYPRGYRVCGGCNRVIGTGNYLGCMGTVFHPECFCCRACSYPITEHEFSLSGRDPYHKSCFKELTHPKCEVCHQFIPTNAAGLIEYRCHPFWSQKYCPSHEHDNTARCCSCERLESWNVRYVSLGDGRSICLECMESAIMDTGDCQPLYHAIRDFYEGLYMKLEQQIPMLLVERQALNEAIVGEKHGFHHMPETRGLCLSEEQTVSSVLRGERIGRHRLIGMKTQPQRLTRKCEVTAILVLFGLPRLLTGAILAHELMHGWLRLNGYRNLNPEIEEGICQMLSYMWLESEVMPSFRNMPSTSYAASSSSSSSSSSKKGDKSELEKKLGEFFMHQIAHDTSPAYGGGFRSANAAVNKYGLRRTLDHIRLTGTFPY